MENCTFKYVLVGFCLVVALVGLYLSAIREKRNIKLNNADIMEGEGDIKGGKFNFKFAIGPLLILLGLIGAPLTLKYVPCDIVAVVASKDTTAHVSNVPENANIRFKMVGNLRESIMMVKSTQPDILNEKRVVAQDDGYFEYLTRLPLTDQKYLALVYKPCHASWQSDSVTPQYRICFTRKKDKRVPQDGYFATILLDLQNTSRLDQDSDHGCVELCDNTLTSRNTSLSFFPTAMAQTAYTPPRSAANAWMVPNLETLNLENESGFSTINIRSVKLTDELKKADRYSYAIRVNSTPIYIDGLPPRYLLNKFAFQKGLDLAFGLENLGFSGVNKGQEKIEVKLDFYNGEQFVSSKTLSFDFVALRKLEMSNIKTADGSEFQWEAGFRANQEFQVFIISTPFAEGAGKAKNNFDAKNMLYKNDPLIGVIRPPYRENKNYGLNAGILLPNGQVRFTFKSRQADSMVMVLKNNNYKPLKRKLSNN